MTILIAVLVLLSGSVYSHEPSEVLTLLEKPSKSIEDNADHRTLNRIARLKSNPMIKEYRKYSINTPKIKKSNIIEINIFSSKSIVAKKLNLRTKGESDFTWIGDIIKGGVGKVILTVVNGHLAGQIYDGTNSYNISYIGSKLYVLQDFNDEQFLFYRK